MNIFSFFLPSLKLHKKLRWDIVLHMNQEKDGGGLFGAIIKENLPKLFIFSINFEFSLVGE